MSQAPSGRKYFFYKRLLEKYPKYTAKNPNKILAPVYNNAVKNCPFCINIMFSFEKDENVVNPPHTPTIRNNRKSGERISLFEEIPTRKPIKKLPNTFTVSVPIGMERKCQ